MIFSQAIARILVAVAVPVFIGGAVMLPGHPCAKAAELDDAGRSLKQAASHLQEQKQKEQDLSQQQQNLRQELEDVRQQQIDIARQVGEKERLVLTYRRSLQDLQHRHNDLHSYLKEHQHQYLHQLSILRAMYRQPELQILQQRHPLAAVRAESLLRHTLPAVQKRLQSYTQAARRIRQHRERINQQLQQVEDATRKLENQRLAMESALERKRLILQLSHEDLRAVQQEVASLRGQVTSLHELIARLQKASASPSQGLSSGGVATKNPLPQSRQWILERPDGVRRFPLSGRIQSPVVGEMVVDYGQKTGPEDRESRGATFRSLPYAQVVATFDGRIAFAGDFGRLGKVVVIEHDGSFHTVLRGLGKIDVLQGQWVFAGEPIGTMGADSSLDSAQLHIELRDAGKTVNPLRWLPRTLASS